MQQLLRFEKDKLLSSLSTFGIGGPAKYFIEVSDIKDLQELILFCSQEKLAYLIIGKGSNCLFDDRGFDGLVILNKIHFCTFLNDCSVHVGSGFSFSLLGAQTARKGLSGLEFASGIPATVGGAVFMNAGANGKETKDHLVSVDYITEEGELICIPKEDLAFSYRFSSFQKRKGAIVGATFTLLPSLEARQKQLQIIDYRTQTQPYKDKSVGCIFRNPEAPLSAGALIEKSGLKGFAVGGAEVSCMHANFIVNKANATAQDVLTLASEVKKVVLEKMQVNLEMEVRVIPYQIGV